MQSMLLRRASLPRLASRNLKINVRNGIRMFTSKQVNDCSDDRGISGKKRRSAKKAKNHIQDPDEEFMQMWSNTEGYIQDQIKQATSGIRKSRRQYVKVWGQNVTTLPLASELTVEERRELLEDDMSVEFRIPKAGDFASLFPVYKSFNGNENDSIAESKDEVVNLDSQITAESDEVDVSNISSFQDFKLHSKLVEKLGQQGIEKPTPIQKEAVPLVLKNKSVLIHSETGSGKTLVFLLPAIQDPGKGFGTVIIVPTRELASQMLYEAHNLLGNKSAVESFVSGVDTEKQEARLKDRDNRPLIVIGTAKRLLEIVENDPLIVHRTKRIIVDEVDKVLLPLKKRSSLKKVILRENHPRPAKLLVEKIKRHSRVRPVQLIGASATVNDELKEDLSELGWGDHVAVIQSPSFEGKRRNIPSCIKHQYVVFDDSFGGTKAQTLARIFRESSQKAALVFVHRLHSVDSFVWELRDLGLNAVALYKKVADQNPEQFQEFLEQFRTGQIEIVVGNEETVRGLDFKELDHVYLMEVPKDVDEYLHLAGRVGRQGRPGTATTMVSTGDPRDERRIKLEYKRLELPFEEIILDDDF
ncbi:probable ATP-dependent RNA helicase YfmL [Acropora millepora]|uniref:probable ATP-dependent RNA helicase YfmL n=1 Tax=Acropora millepora TaxID=45264 RepID=UPI001CF4ACDE|nr:probable ATP-dependent RNA helicase YfmL [Acropora millepora]